MSQSVANMPAGQTGSFSPSPARSSGSDATTPVHVVAIGGIHQFAHIVPVACEIERRQPGSVTLFVLSHKDAAAAATVIRENGLAMPAITIMTIPLALRPLAKAGLGKILALATWSGHLARARVLLCAERTSTILRRLRPDCPPIVHIPHGAGDRAVGFEPRFKLFDQVLVAGNKDRDRLIASGLVAPEDCLVAGPIKLAAILERGIARPPLFDNARPTILFNPHFSKKHSSLDSFGRQLAEAVRKDGRYNLVIAPHARMAKSWSKRRRRSWQALAETGRIIVDLGSPRCNDMTYTLGADLYIGDVSSQVYEFLIRPRPCLFVDAKGIDWQGSEDYAMWHFGEVVAPDCAPIAAIDRAFAQHGAYVAWQRQRMAYSIAGMTWAPDGTPLLEGTAPGGSAADAVMRWAALPQEDALRTAA